MRKYHSDALGAGSYPDAPDLPDPPRCPVCGGECERVYKYEGEIVGCDGCLAEVDAYGEPECYPAPERVWRYG